MTAVETRALRKSYGAPAVNGIDLAVQGGECFGFFGPNDAGESTLMKRSPGARIGDGSRSCSGAT